LGYIAYRGFASIRIKSRRHALDGVVCYAICGGLMLYLYLDESGDLGFDFVNKKPSEHFTIAVLAVKGHDNNRAIASAVRMTIRRKLRSLRAGAAELKGHSTPLEVKKYFYRKVAAAYFSICSITFNKRRTFQFLAVDKERIYNFIARLVLEKVDLADTKVRVILTVDKSKTTPGIRDFNALILAQLKSRLDPHIPLEIIHKSSHEAPQLQAVDLFAWGIFRRYEREDNEWRREFSGKIVFDGLYDG